MQEITPVVSFKYRINQFIWQHLWLLVSLFIMTLGVALSVRSNVGSSVISSLPMSFALAGSDGLFPALTIGEYTNIMNILFVALQFVILRRDFEWVQLFQLVIGFLFGAMIDFNMLITSGIDCSTPWMQAIVALAGCTVMAVGISMEIRCGSVTMPGEGIQVAVCRKTGAAFPKVKIIIDTTLVVLAVISCYWFWGEWKWNVIGPGTLFAMIYVGWMVKIVNRHSAWFDKLLNYPFAFKKIAYGLARYIRR